MAAQSGRFTLLAADMVGTTHRWAQVVRWREQLPSILACFVLTATWFVVLASHATALQRDETGAVVAATAMVASVEIMAASMILVSFPKPKHAALLRGFVSGLPASAAVWIPLVLLHRGHIDIGRLLGGYGAACFVFLVTSACVFQASERMPWHTFVLLVAVMPLIVALMAVAVSLPVAYVYFIVLLDDPLLEAIIIGFAYPLLSALNKASFSDAMINGVDKILRQGGIPIDTESFFGAMIRSQTIANYFPGLAALQQVRGVAAFLGAVMLAGGAELLAHTAALAKAYGDVASFLRCRRGLNKVSAESSSDDGEPDVVAAKTKNSKRLRAIEYVMSDIGEKNIVFFGLAVATLSSWIHCGAPDGVLASGSLLQRTAMVVLVEAGVDLTKSAFAATFFGVHSERVRFTPTAADRILDVCTLLCAVFSQSLGRSLHRLSGGTGEAGTVVWDASLRIPQPDRVFTNSTEGTNATTFSWNESMCTW